jgi:hypothetical protein
MSVELIGVGHVTMFEDSLNAVFKIGRAFGWVPEYVRAAAEAPGLNDFDDIPAHNARALANVLYRVIHMIESDTLSESLVELVRVAGVGNIRAVADLAATDTFYID